MAQSYAAQVRGAATFVVQTHTTVRAGPMAHTEFSETAYAVADGAPSGKIVLRSLVNNAAANADQLAKLSAEPDRPLSRFGLRLPLLESAAGDYHYGELRESGGRTDVDFTAKVKDQAHGDGTASFDVAQKHVTQLVIRPAVLPPHATRMTITVEFGSVYEGRWDVVKITRTFSGREGFMTGSGSTTSVYDRYQIHASPADALKALNAIVPAAT